MKCPKCGCAEDKVLDSRTCKEGAVIRRRRECVGCGYRYTTHEEIEKEDFYVVKRDGRREMYERDKLEKSLRIACRKRPVSEAQVQDIVRQVESACVGNLVTSETIGELVMKFLVSVDEVAYIRFASVYNRFSDVQQFLNAVRDMMLGGEK